MVCAAALVRLCVLLGVLLARPMHHSSSSKQVGGNLPILASAASNSSAPPGSDLTHPFPGHTAQTDRNVETTSSDFSALDIADDGIRCVPTSTYGLQQNIHWGTHTCPLENVSESRLVEDGTTSFIQHSINSGRKRHRSDQDDNESSSLKRYACRFCTMTFHKSQALGGHMNKHKQERQNESWNKAFELIQHGTPSLALPGQDQSFLSRPSHMQRSLVPSEHGASGGVSYSSMQYLGAGSEPTGAKSHLDIATDFSSFKSAEYLDAHASSDVYRNIRHFDAMMPFVPPSYRPIPYSQWPSRLSTVMPYETEREDFDNLFSSSSLRMEVPQHGTRNFLDEHASALAPRGISPQDFMPRYAHTSPLPAFSSLASMQPGILQAEAVHGASYYESQDRGPVYSYPTERRRTCASQVDAPSHTSLTSMPHGVAQAEASHDATYFGAQCANPVHAYTTETIRESTSLASSCTLAERVCYMYTGTQTNENAQQNQISGRYLAGHVSSLTDPQILHHEHTNPQGIAGVGAGAYDLAPPRQARIMNPQGIAGAGAGAYNPASPRQARIMSGPMWSSYEDAHRKTNALTALQPTTSSSAEHEGSYEENNPPIKPD